PLASLLSFPTRRSSDLVVAALALPLCWMAYVAGFGGGKERGLSLVEEAANYAGESQADARFALVLMYNRERRYDDALKQLVTLRDRKSTRLNSSHVSIS